MSAVSFLDLLDSSIRDSNKAAVDFGSLYRLLHALLTHLGIRDLMLGGGLLNQNLNQTNPETDTAALPEPVEEVRSATDFSGPQSLLNRVQKCEDELTRVMALIRDLRNQESMKELQDETKEMRESMKEVMDLQEQMKEVRELQEKTKEMKELQDEMKEVREHQEKMKELQEQMKEVKELQEQMKELQEPKMLVTDFQEQMKKLKEHQEQMKETCVTWDVLQASLLVGQQVQPCARVADASPRHSSPEQEPPDTCESWRSKEDTTGLRGTGSAASLLDATQTDTEAAGPYGSSLFEQHQQTLEVLRDIGRLRNQRLDQRVTLLEEGMVDQTQLTPLYQLINRGSLDAKQLIKDQEQQRSLIENMMKHQMDVNRSLQDLEQKTTNKHVVETELKVDQLVLDSKVSRRDFDSVTEQLNSMFHELLNRVSGQEQNWQQLMERLSNEMDCKLNRPELDSVKKQLEDRWKMIQSKLQTQEEPENQDAAGLRKQLIDRFHCLSCDRPIAKLAPGPRLVTLPSSPGLPSHKSIRPFTVYALEQFRHHYRSSDSVSAATDHQMTSRRSGRSHTAVSGVQRRTKQVKQQTEAELQSEEVDIVGLDGQVYRGRLNAAPFGNLDTKLPDISSKDASCKTEDKSRNSTHRNLQSPESRGGSCGSGRARSVLGYPSQSSILQTPAADLLDPTPFQM